MDVLWFLKRRTQFVRDFYAKASADFSETKRRIEAGEPPFDNSPDDDSGEPAFLEQWQDADQALDFLGQSCVSFLAASVKLYLNESEREFRNDWGDVVEIPALDAKELKNYGFVRAYRSLYARLGINFEDSGANVDLVEEIVLTRNRAEHPESIGFTHLTQSKTDRARFPHPFFAHPLEEALWEREGGTEGHEFPWMLVVTQEKLLLALEEVERLFTWLDAALRSGPKQLPTDR